MLRFLLTGAKGHRVSFFVTTIDVRRGVCEQGRAQRGLSERVRDANPRVSSNKRGGRYAVSRNVKRVEADGLKKNV